MGEVRGGAAARPSPFSPLPKTSARSVGITGSSLSRPLSKRLRHSSPTEAGSRRYCSYITCTNAALWVPKTNSLTKTNLTRRQTSDIRRQYILRAMFRRRFLLLVLLACSTPSAQALGQLRERL